MIEPRILSIFLQFLLCCSAFGANSNSPPYGAYSGFSLYAAHQDAEVKHGLTSLEFSRDGLLIHKLDAEDRVWTIQYSNKMISEDVKDYSFIELMPNRKGYAVWPNAQSQPLFIMAFDSVSSGKFEVTIYAPNKPTERILPLAVLFPNLSNGRSNLTKIIANYRAVRQAAKSSTSIAANPVQLTWRGILKALDERAAHIGKNLSDLSMLHLLNQRAPQIEAGKIQEWANLAKTSLGSPSLRPLIHTLFREPGYAVVSTPVVSEMLKHAEDFDSEAFRSLVQTANQLAASISLLVKDAKSLFIRYGSTDPAVIWQTTGGILPAEFEYQLANVMLERPQALDKLSVIKTNLVLELAKIAKNRNIVEEIRESAEQTIIRIHCGEDLEPEP